MSDTIYTISEKTWHIFLIFRHFTLIYNKIYERGCSSADLGQIPRIRSGNGKEGGVN